MSMSDMEFRAVLLDQMKDYLDGRIMDVAKSFAPDYDVEEIYKKLME